MDELSRDLMSGEGGLQALNGGLEGNLGKWAEGEALRQTADEPEPDYRHGNAAAPMPPGAVLLAIVLAAVGAILVLFAAL